MTIRVVRLGTPRSPGEGLRLGTVRRPPRGVRKEDFGRRDFYDHWLPDLAPGAELLAWATAEPLDEARWQTFERRYRKEMAAPAAERLLGLLAALSRQTDLAVGCYCADVTRCHRRLLGELLREAGATVTFVEPDGGGQASLAARPAPTD
jgi:uncharacterized protein YeaO (DUF488 family)